MVPGTTTECGNAAGGVALLVCSGETTKGALLYNTVGERAVLLLALLPLLIKRA